MSETVNALLPILTFGASVAGAGWVSSRLIDKAREVWPAPLAAPKGVALVLYNVLYAPRYARVLSIALAVAIGAACAALRAYLTGEAVSPAVDGAVAALVSQYVHGRTLSPDALFKHGDDVARGEE